MLLICLCPCFHGCKLAFGLLACLLACSLALRLFPDIICSWQHCCSWLTSFPTFYSFAYCFCICKFSHTLLVCFLAFLHSCLLILYLSVLLHCWLQESNLVVSILALLLAQFQAFLQITCLLCCLLCVIILVACLLAYFTAFYILAFFLIFAGLLVFLTAVIVTTVLRVLLKS